MQLSLNNGHIGYLSVSSEEWPQMISFSSTNSPNCLFFRKSFRWAPRFDTNKILFIIIVKASQPYLELELRKCAERDQMSRTKSGN